MYSFLPHGWMFSNLEISLLCVCTMQQYFRLLISCCVLKENVSVSFSQNRVKRDQLSFEILRWLLTTFILFNLTAALKIHLTRVFIGAEITSIYSFVLLISILTISTTICSDIIVIHATAHKWFFVTNSVFVDALGVCFYKLSIWFQPHTSSVWTSDSSNKSNIWFPQLLLFWLTGSGSFLWKLTSLGKENKSVFVILATARVPIVLGVFLFKMLLWLKPEIQHFSD